MEQIINEFKEIMKRCGVDEQTAAILQRNKIEQDRNNIIKQAFCVNDSLEPVSLEAIAMVLGYKKNGKTLVDAINNLKNH